MNKVTVYANPASVEGDFVRVVLSYGAASTMPRLTLDNAKLPDIQRAVETVRAQLSESAQIGVSIAGRSPNGYAKWYAGARNQLLHIV